jgi:hypothetical protein
MACGSREWSAVGGRCGRNAWVMLVRPARILLASSRRVFWIRSTFTLMPGGRRGGWPLGPGWSNGRAGSHLDVAFQMICCLLVACDILGRRAERNHHRLQKTNQLRSSLIRHDRH